MPSLTATGIAFEVDGPATAVTPVVLVHAGIADRRMWDELWPALTVGRRALRLDLRGFGESERRPDGVLDHAHDLRETLDAAGFPKAHFVGVSLGAGVVVELALTEPHRAASLVLVAPGGALFAGPTDELREFWRAEGEALDRGDIDAAVEANLRTWVDGRGRPAGTADAMIRSRVADMQRRAFELTLGWNDVDEAEPDVPVVNRLEEIAVPTLVLAGARDVDAVAIAAGAIRSGVPGAQLVEWPDVAHLPPLERPAEFAALLLAWLDEVGGTTA